MDPHQRSVRMVKRKLYCSTHVKPVFFLYFFSKETRRAILKSWLSVACDLQTRAESSNEGAYMWFRLPLPPIFHPGDLILRGNIFSVCSSSFRYSYFDLRREGKYHEGSLHRICSFFLSALILFLLFGPHELWILSRFRTCSWWRRNTTSTNNTKASYDFSQQQRESSRI